MGIISRSQSGGGGITKLPAAQLSRAAQTGGNLTTANTAGVYAELAAVAGGPGTGGFDLTIAAAANDVLLVSGGVACYNATALGVGFDVATWVSGAAVNWLGQSAGGNNNGLGSINTAVAVLCPLLVQYVVQAGDITGGNVVLRLHYLATGARVIARSVATGVLTLGVTNLLH
jgi:hypothetical protein